MNKKSIVIFIIVIVVLLMTIGSYLVFFKEVPKKEFSKDEEKVTENQKVEDKLVAPAKDTIDLINTLTEIKAEEVTANEITFSSAVELNEGEKVAVWLYSEPKFLGYFEVIIKDGIKKIEGLTQALAKINVEKGKHNIAIVTASGKELGYIDVYLNDDGLSEFEVKEVVEKETINYKTTKQEEVNMKLGTKEVIQTGQKGEKEVTYKVTYDEFGKEVSREKIKEDVTKEAVDQIEKVGVSEFNLKTDMLTEISFGPACTENQLLTDEYGSKECDSLNYSNLPEYYAVKINNSYYITSIKENGVEKLSNPLKVTGTDGILLKASYKGTQYYFYMSGGGGQYEPLTNEMCTKYNFSCGTW